MSERSDSFLLRAVSGGVSGCVEAVITMPFEVCKIQQQIYATRSLSATAHRVIAAEGPRGLFLGLPAQLVQSSGKVGIRFGFYEAYLGMLGGNSPGDRLVAGFLAGGTEAALWVTPCERLKILRLSQVGRLSVGLPVHHRSFFVSLKNLMVQKPLELWRGVGPTLLRNAGTVGFRFAAYEHVSKTFHSFGATHLSGFISLASGFCVGVLSTLLNNPIDVVKSRLQAEAVPVHGQQSSRRLNSFACAREVIREGGVRALWRGSIARCWKIGVGQAIIFGTYDSIVKFLSDVICMP